MPKYLKIHLMSYIINNFILMLEKCGTLNFDVAKLCLLLRGYTASIGHCDLDQV